MRQRGMDSEVLLLLLLKCGWIEGSDDMGERSGTGREGKGRDANPWIYLLDPGFEGQVSFKLMVTKLFAVQNQWSDIGYNVVDNLLLMLIWKYIGHGESG